MKVYTRAPSTPFLAVLGPGGLLAPLLKPRQVAGLRLDVHLRSHDHVHVYCGLTRVLDAKLAHGRAHVGADPRYTAQACGADLFRPNGRALGDGGFEEALDHYYQGVLLNPRFTRGEGVV